MPKKLLIVKRDKGDFAQGVYLFTADGKLLGFSNTADAKQVKGLLEKALRKFDPSVPAPKLTETKAGDALPPPPVGGLVLDVGRSVTCSTRDRVRG